MEACLLLLNFVLAVEDVVFTRLLLSHQHTRKKDARTNYCH